jgi:hypothetical protein
MKDSPLLAKLAGGKIEFKFVKEISHDAAEMERLYTPR